MPINGFIVDFASVEAKLVVELDGGQHATQVERDERRTDVLVASGYTVLRFWNSDVTENLEGVLETIRQAAER